MPLPLPNLDTRRWSDLVDEGRALLPRYSPEWTDFNVHDPGIMLVELFAWLSEELLYRANRIPDRHLRKFLALCGYSPAPPMPASAVLGVTLAPATGSLLIPAGVAFDVDAGAGGIVPFRTTEAVTLVEIELVALQSFDGARYRDASRALRDTLPILVMGAEPTLPSPYVVASAPAMYLGFDRAIPPLVPLRLHLAFADARPGELQRLLAEEAARAAACARSPETCTPCATDDGGWCGGDDATGDSGGGTTAPSAPSIPPHHSVRTVWEWLAADGWHAFDASLGDVIDETRGLTLDGAVQLRVPGVMTAAAIGAVTAPRFWVRCRLIEGAYDAPPMLSAVVRNAVLAEQAREQWQRFVIAAGATVSGTPTAGTRAKLDLQINAAGLIQAITVPAADPSAPDILVLDYVAPTATTAGTITLLLRAIGAATGLPDDQPLLPGAPLSRGELALWTIEGSGATTAWRSWQPRADLDSAGPLDARATLDAVTGAVRFGDGVRGRVPPAGAAIVAAYATTSGAAGNVAAGRSWTLVDGPLNHALLGATFGTLDAATAGNALAASGGADAEDIGQAAARAAAALWSHERLVQLCPTGSCATLDQLDRASVLDCAEPERAATLLDFERIAIDVPGTRVRRARAWSQFDPAVPCAEASGTVTVVIVPSLPRALPSPSAGLVRAVKRWLDRRRVLCTRLVVVGPEYLVVSVTASVTTATGADPARVRADVVAALATFLDPLVGGPASRGWPFGRDVYRSELLAVIDDVPGVDHVTTFTMEGNCRASACGNLCVPPTWLVASGTHAIEAMRA